MLLVRRKAKAIPADLCSKGKAGCISWADTVLLNLVLQIAFQLTVTVSRCVQRPTPTGHWCSIQAGSCCTYTPFVPAKGSANEVWDSQHSTVQSIAIHLDYNDWCSYYDWYLTTNEH